MGAPTRGALAKFNSVTSATDLNNLLVTAIKNLTMKYRESGQNAEVSGDGETVTKYVAGLHESSLDFEGVYPKASPRWGNAGLVTFASGYVQYCDGWTMDFDFGEDDITSFAASAPTSKVFMPSDRPIVTGTFSVRAVTDTALSPPSALNGIGASAAFKICEDGTDPAFTGLIIVDGEDGSFGGRNQQRVTYNYRFSDTVTSVAGSTLPAILPAGTVDPSDWDLDGDGVPDVTTVWQSAASRTYSAAGYLKSLSIAVSMGDVIKVSGTIRNSGPVTRA